MMTLADTCLRLQEEIRNNFELGHGDAADLFDLIWAKMTDGPNNKKLQEAIDMIEETYFDFL